MLIIDQLLWNGRSETLEGKGLNKKVMSIERRGIERLRDVLYHRLDIETAFTSHTGHP